MEVAEYQRMYALETAHWWFRAKRRMVYALLDAERRAADTRVLDVGCGTGMTLRELPPGCRGVGVDPSPEALALSRARGLTVLARASATDLPLREGSVDVVLALDIVEHIEDDVAALREIARVIGPRGVGILTVPAHPFLWSDHDEALHHKRRYSRALLESRLAQAGLCVRTGGYGQATVLLPAALLRIGRRWLRRGRPGSGGSDVGELPRWLNALAYRVVGWEIPLIRRGALPLGLSLVYVVARAPASPAVAGRTA